MSLFTIDGNMCSGKTSILKYMNSKYGLYIDINENDDVMPTKINKDNAFRIFTRMWLDKGNVKIKNNCYGVENSPYFTRQTVIKDARAQKFLTDDEYEMMMEMHNITADQWSKNIYIYIKTNPATCFDNRIYDKKYENTEYLYFSANDVRLDVSYQNAVLSGKRIHIINAVGKQPNGIGDEIWKIINSYD